MKLLKQRHSRSKPRDKAACISHFESKCRAQRGKHSTRKNQRRAQRNQSKRVLAIVTVLLVGVFAICGIGAQGEEPQAEAVSKPSTEKTVARKHRSKSNSKSKATSKAKSKAAKKADSKTLPAAAPGHAHLGTLVVKFVDVGQGDASILEFPDGKTMLIDTPRRKASTVMSTLRADGHTTIDWLVATHPDADHIGGLDSIITQMDIKSIWAPEVNSPTKTYTRFLTAIANKNMSIEPAYAGRQIAKGEGYSIDILWPNQHASYSEDNDYSAIVKVTFGENTFLFTGDAPVEAQNQSVDGHVDVLKVSHHGSASGLDGALASKLSPKIAVLSYGKNSYGHPTQIVLDALSSANATVFGTYVNGTVTITSNGVDINASAEHEGTIKAASKSSGASSQGLGTAGGGGGSSGAAASTQTAPAPAPAPAATDSGSNETVVVTPSGRKYHRPGCRTTKRSKSLTQMPKSQAQGMGLEACRVCNP